jgi:hypothetical protein
MVLEQQEDAAIYSKVSYKFRDMSESQQKDNAIIIAMQQKRDCENKIADIGFDAWLKSFD